MFEEVKWEVVAHNGQKYTCIGYESRGLFGVPVVNKIDGKYISATVYEAINGMLDKGFYGVTKLNDIEIRLLEKNNWKYDGCWIHQEG